MLCNLIIVIKMKNRYEKTREVKGNHELLDNAIKNVDKKIHELNERDWTKFKKSLRDNFLMVLGLQEMREEMLIQTSQEKRR